MLWIFRESGRLRACRNGQSEVRVIASFHRWGTPLMVVSGPQEKGSRPGSSSSLSIKLTDSFRLDERASGHSPDHTRYLRLRKCFQDFGSSCCLL